MANRPRAMQRVRPSFVRVERCRDQRMGRGRRAKRRSVVMFRVELRRPREVNVGRGRHFAGLEGG